MPVDTAGSEVTVSGWRHARAVLLLPFMNTVAIPGLLIAMAPDYRVLAPAGGRFVQIAGLLALAAGLWLVGRSILLFRRMGRGTLAPWDPTRELITVDVYRFSRNPMKTGLFLVLIGECLLLGSTVLAIWTMLFIAVNVLYIRWFEEPGLERRFGARYAEYRTRVPRWFGSLRYRQDRWSARSPS